MCFLSLVIGGQIVLVPVVESTHAPTYTNQVSANPYIIGSFVSTVYKIIDKLTIC